MSGRRRMDRLYEDAGELIAEYTGEESVDLSEWTDDPVAFATQMGRAPLDYQGEVMRSVAENRFTAWRGCHGCGKEFTAGLIVPWAACVRRMLVLVISATETQVVKQTMREIGRGFRAVSREYGHASWHLTRSIRFGGRDGEDRVIALTGGADVDALTGWHDPNGVLVVISEGQGERLENVAYDAALANANTDRCRVLAMGNPVRPEGRFYEVFQKSHWKRFKTSAFDTPNVKAGEMVVPGCPGPDWPKEVAADHNGKDSAFYVSRVLAEFPAESEEQLVPTEAIEAAFERYPNPPAKSGTPFILGVDPAGPGEDQFAVTVWRGWTAIEYRTWRHLEAPESAEKILDLMRELRRGVLATHGGADVSTIYVDEIGIGHGLTGILKRECRGHEWINTHVEGVNVSVKPAEPKRFMRWKDELIWRLREDLVEGRIGLAPNEKLKEEIQQLRVRQTPSGKIETEPKDKMRARLGRSPDVLDSLLLTVASRSPAGGGRARLIA